MKSDFRNYLFVFIAGSLWGTIGFWVKMMQANGSSSAYTSFVRMLLGCVILVAITLIKDGFKAFKVSRGTLISCMLLGFICQGLYNLMYSSAVNTAGMALASVLLYTAPIFTAIESKLFFREKFSAKKYVALLINIMGCALTVTGGKLGGLSFAVIGIVYGVAAGFLYSLTPVFGRIAASGDGTPFSISSYNFIFATIFLALFRPWNTVANPWEPKIWLWGLGFAIIPTAISYLFYYDAMAHIKETSKVPVIASVETVIATILGIVIFRENFGAVNVIGMLCVFGSIALMNLDFGKKKEPKPDKA
ncbi:MAG: EamA family transporter [Mogibacterium sp.]|nr:EamA family transporter [Mogibacterium sp.]